MRALRPSDEICRTRFIRSESASSTADASPVGIVRRGERSRARRSWPNIADAKILPERLRQNGTNGAMSFAVVTRHFVERPVGVELFRAALVGGPEAVAAAAHVPVRKGVDELGDLLASGEVVVSVHPLDDGGACAVQLAEDPAIELAALGDRAVGLGSCKNAQALSPCPLHPAILQPSAAGSKPSMFA